VTLHRCEARNRRGRLIVEQHRDIADLKDGLELKAHLRAMIASKNQSPNGGEKLLVYSSERRPKVVAQVSI
jgi:hypothetical protein